LQRGYRELHLDGVIMPSYIAGKYFDEPEYQPFGDALAAAGEDKIFCRNAQKLLSL
jgi:hypothetical protein